jgi:hypothetical protein
MPGRSIHRSEDWDFRRTAATCSFAAPGTFDPGREPSSLLRSFRGYDFAKVDVTVDDQRYRVETMWERPIVCELPAGRHLLRMLRSGRVLFEQEFTLDAGQEVVLTAWEGFNDQGTAADCPLSPGLGPRISPGNDRRNRGDVRLDQFGLVPFRSGPVSAEQTFGQPP